MTPLQQLFNNVYSCDWADSPLLFISGNVFSPIIYYSHAVPMIAGLLLAFIVWKQDSRSRINVLFISVSLFFAIWTSLDLLLWADKNPNHIMFAWTLESYVEPLIYFSTFYLVYLFIAKKDLAYNFKILGVALILPILFFGPSKYLLSAFDYTNCDREAIEGIVWQYIYFIEILTTLAMVVFAIYSAIRTKVKGERMQILLFSLGTFLFLTAFSLGNIVGSSTENWSLAQYGLLGMPLFLGIVLYLITRFNTFKISVISTSVLVWSLWFLLFSILFLQSIEIARPIIIGTLVVFSLVGLQLIKSVKNEIEQKNRIQELASNLEQSNEQQVLLIHFITHQIKGFVAKSRNIFSMALEGDFGPIGPELKPMLQAGFDSDTKGAGVIQEILNAANIKSGKVTYTMEAFDLRPLIEDMVNYHSAGAKEKGVSVQMELGTEPVRILGDRAQLMNVFKNVIDNSIKYTPKGEVRISLTPEPEKKMVLFSIKDTGVGITPEDMQNLFTEGGHGKDSVKVNVESTGFGLYIVKQIVDAHKGRVWAESEGAGKGSQFYVELPTP